jgi:hypothetical protein
MATTDDSIDGLTEHCERCERETLHQVSVQIMAENDTGQNAEYSREPLRVAECQRCGGREIQRMNDS